MKYLVNKVITAPYKIRRILLDQAVYVKRIHTMMPIQSIVKYYKSKYSDIRRVVKLPPIKVSPQSPELPELHVLTCNSDYYMSISSIYSWYRTTGKYLPLVIHDDGTLNRHQKENYRRIFQGCRIVDRKQADHEIERAFFSEPWLLKWRSSLTLSLKFIDMPYYAVSNRVLILDSDAYFFKKPVHVLEALEVPQTEIRANVFLHDIIYAYSYPESALKEMFGEIPLYINTGLCVFDKRSLDLSILYRLVQNIPAATNPGWLEQTAFALSSLKYGYTLLPLDQYETVHGLMPEKKSSILRHYVSTYRFLYYVEALHDLLGDVPE